MRLHRDAPADEATRRLNIEAFTSGETIAFGRSAPDPDSPAGRHILAHEVAHVLQQRRGGTSATQPFDPTQKDRAEAEAERAAKAVTSGRSFSVRQPATSDVQAFGGELLETAREAVDRGRQEVESGAARLWEEKLDPSLRWMGGVLAGDFNEEMTSGQANVRTVITAIPYVGQVANIQDIVAALYHEESLHPALRWIGGVLAGDFNEEMTIGQIVLRTAITLIPGVDQVADAQDIIAALYKLVWEERYDEIGPWIDLVLTLIGLIPTLGSAIKGVLKGVFRSAGDGGRKIIEPVARRIGTSRMGKEISDQLVTFLDESASHRAFVREKADELFDAVQHQTRKRLDQLEDAKRRFGSHVPDHFQARLDRTIDAVNEFHRRLRLARRIADPMVDRAFDRVARNLEKLALRILEIRRLDALKRALPDHWYEQVYKQAPASRKIRMLRARSADEWAELARRRRAGGSDWKGGDEAAWRGFPEAPEHHEWYFPSRTKSDDGQWREPRLRFESDASSREGAERVHYEPATDEIRAGRRSADELDLDDFDFSQWSEAIDRIAGDFISERQVKKIVARATENPHIGREGIGELLDNIEGFARHGSDIEGAERVVTELEKGHNFQSGAYFMVRHLHRDGGWSDIKEFEKRPPGGGIEVRRWDAVTNDEVLRQYKTWGRFDKRTFVRQLSEDLKAQDNRLDDIEWIFDVSDETDRLKPSEIFEKAKEALSDEALIDEYLGWADDDFVAKLANHEILEELFTFAAF